MTLYRGEFMEGFSLPDSPEYEQWLLLNREQLRRQALETMQHLVTFLEEHGEYGRGLEYAWREVELDPLREPARQGLMRLLALNSQREKALVQYEIYTRLLAADLGVEPSVETRKLYELIKKGEFPPSAGAELKTDIRQPMTIGACPYRGLAAFQEQDAPFFFGREKFTHRLVEALRSRLVAMVIVGSSGSGKSSLVRAGLISNLRAQSDWLIVDLRPGASPYHSLSVALLPLLEPDMSETDRLIESQKLATALSDSSLPLHRLLERVLEKELGKTRLLLFIDQFEELYTLCKDPETQRNFLDALLGAFDIHLERRENAIALLLTMRADFMGQALAHRPFADILQRSALMLGPMSREELRAAIEKPAEVQGAAFEAGLVERILDDVGDEPGGLPLLEFAMTLLWERAESGWLTHEAYEAVGEVKGALAGYADQVYGELAEDDRELARQVFLQLIRPGEGTEDTRRVAQRTEVGETSWALVQHLADKRLVVTGRAVAGEETVEIVHEALIGNWERLRSWIEAERAFRTWQEGLRSAMRRWEATGEDEGALLRGAPLAEAEGWRGSHTASLSETELEFINAGIQLRERDASERELLRQRELQSAQQLARSERRRRNILLAFAAVLSIAIVATLLLTSFSLSQRREALTAYSSSLAANAQQALDESDSATALTLAMAANAVDQPSLMAQRILMDAAYSPGARQKYEIANLFSGTTGSVTAIASSPDGKTILLGFEGGQIIVWETGSSQEFSLLQGHSAKVNDIEIDHDGLVAVSVGDEMQAIVWDLRAGKKLRRLNGHSGIIRAVDISQDGRFVVTGGFSGSGWEQPGELILWELESGEEIRRFTGHVAGVVAAEFCLGDHAILASSGDAELFSSIGADDPQQTETLLPRPTPVGCRKR